MNVTIEIGWHLIDLSNFVSVKMMEIAGYWCLVGVDKKDRGRDVLAVAYAETSNDAVIGGISDAIESKSALFYANDLLHNVLPPEVIAFLEGKNVAANSAANVSSPPQPAGTPVGDLTPADFGFLHGSPEISTP